MRRVKQNRKTRTRQIDRFQLYKLSDLHYFNITFLGIVCPYPETPFFRQLAKEGRILPNTVSRDYDGYTLCHRPLALQPAEVIEHFKRLCRQLGSLTNVARHYHSKLWTSAMPHYRKVILASGPEILSVRNPISNPKGNYIAGFDPIEEWDRKMMEELSLPLQRIGRFAPTLIRPRSKRPSYQSSLLQRQLGTA